MKELSSMNVKELEVICKESNIHYYSGKRHLRKDEMISLIEESNKGVSAEESLQKKGRVEYIKDVQEGVMIAFMDNYGKARTAKVGKNIKEDEIIIATTEFGRTFKIPYKNVLWVRKENNPRWPRPIYEMLKGRK